MSSISPGFSVADRKAPHDAHFEIASGEVATTAVKTRAKGCLRLGAPISFARLAGVPIKCASGASENRRKR